MTHITASSATLSCAYTPVLSLPLLQVQELFGVDRAQTVKRTMCDSADAIVNAFRTSYSQSENVQCFSHIVCV
jgi:hypothetical protein